MQRQKDIPLKSLSHPNREKTLSEKNFRQALMPPLSSSGNSEPFRNALKPTSPFPSDDLYINDVSQSNLIQKRPLQDNKYVQQPSQNDLSSEKDLAPSDLYTDIDEVTALAISPQGTGEHKGNFVKYIKKYITSRNIGPKRHKKAISVQERF